MESDVYFSINLGQLLFVLSLVAFFFALWKAVRQGFPLYWTLVAGLVILGPVTLLSPVYLLIPVSYWDTVVYAGMCIMFGAVLAVAGGYVADGVRSYRRRHP